MVEVQPMKKVHVAVSLLDSKNSQVDSKEKVMFSFIYGIGKGGLTPFECVLEGCQQGDFTQTEVSSQTIAAFFGVLCSPVKPLIEGKIAPPVLHIGVEIVKVEEAEYREVVAALAGSAGGCGSGGSCGCGCS